MVNDDDVVKKKKMMKVGVGVMDKNMFVVVVVVVHWDKEILAVVV